MTNTLIYLDHNSTTPVDPRVVQAMLPFLTEHFGNPSSATHAAGWHAAEAVKVAREHVGRAVGADAEEIVFTSGATEANNLAILGAARRFSMKRKVISARTEHSSLLGPLRRLAAEGFEVELLPVLSDGTLAEETLRAALVEGEPGLVSIMLANNEIGSINRIAELCRAAHENGSVFHCDATQALGKLPISASDWNVDLLSVSGHKVYGPKGAGALCCRNGYRGLIEPLMYGGEQEGDVRPGTSNVPAIVGFGEAARLAPLVLEEDGARLKALASAMFQALTAELPGVSLNGPPIETRLPGNLNVTIAGADAGRLLAALAAKVALSAGSACFSGSKKASHVLYAIGLRDPALKQSIRIGLGRFTTEREVDEASAAIIKAAKRIVGTAD